VLVVKLELWPGGNPARAREIGRVDIANVGGDPDFADYAVSLQAGRDWNDRAGSVTGHDRQLPAWVLVSRALRAVWMVP